MNVEAQIRHNYRAAIIRDLPACKLPAKQHKDIVSLIAKAETQAELAAVKHLISLATND